jgi:integrase/recombinase XerD
MVRPAPLIRCALPFEQWPAIDRDLCNMAFTPAGLFEEGGTGAQLRDVSKKGLIGAYGRWLRFLSLSDPNALRLPPERRVTEKRLRAWLEVLERLAPLSIWSYMHDLRQALAYMCLNAEFPLLRLVSNRLRRVAHPLVSPDLKARDTRVLYPMALAHMERAESEPEYRPLMGSSAFRDGFMIALTCVVPLRRRTIHELTINRHIDRREERISINLYEENLKTGPAWSFHIPGTLLPYLELYLDHHRPRLLQGNSHDALWITYEGLPLSLNGVGRRFDKATPKIFGERVMTHSFRHSAASTMAEHAPAAIGHIPGLLGHTSAQSHQRYYQKSLSIAAAVRQRDMLADRRRRLQAELAASADPGGIP